MTDNSDEEMPDIDAETWPRAELVGGPMDGHRILAPEPKYREPLAVPFKKDMIGPLRIGGPPEEFAKKNMQLHWYVPMTVKNVLRKLSVFYYAYAGTSAVDEQQPDAGTLYDRSTIAHPAFPEEE